MNSEVNSLRGLVEVLFFCRFQPFPLGLNVDSLLTSRIVVQLVHFFFFLASHYPQYKIYPLWHN